MARWDTDLDLIYRVFKTQATPGFGCAKIPSLQMERNGKVSSFIHTGVAPTCWLFYGITIVKWALVQKAKIMTIPIDIQLLCKKWIKTAHIL